MSLRSNLVFSVQAEPGCESTQSTRTEAGILLLPFIIVRTRVCYFTSLTWHLVNTKKVLAVISISQYFRSPLPFLMTKHVQLASMSTGKLPDTSLN